MLHYRAHAKVNLSLHITDKRKDGYHSLSSLVVFPEFGDDILINPNGIGHLSFKGEFASSVPPFKNSVTDALNWFQSKFSMNISPDIEVHKNIPVQAGLGGGTADAAAVISALCDLYNQPRPAPATLNTLGSDVPISFYGQPAIMEGIGEIITPVTLNRGYGMVLIYPYTGIPTTEAFNQLKKFDQRIEIKAIFDLQDIQSMTNSLEAPSIEMCPEIGNLINETLKFEPHLVRMTGSGSTVFVLTKLGQEERLAQLLRSKYPDYWVNSTHVNRSTT